jgi:Fic family protein
MVILKPDTSAGFRPSIPKGAEFESANRATLRLDGRLEAGVLGPSIHHLLLGMARLRNVVSTLRIEGEEIDLEGARRAFELQKAETPAEEQTLRLCKEYTRIHSLRQGEIPDLSIPYILDLHKRMFGGVHPEAAPGRLKTRPNGVGDTMTGRITFRATPPERTRKELEQLLLWYEQARHKAGPVSVAAIFFAEFEGIHPFHDGNGRIGRLLSLVCLKQLGLENIALTPLDGRFYHTHAEYYDRIASTNNGRSYVPWTRYYGHQLLKAYQIAVRRSDLKGLIEAQTRPSTRRVFEWVLSRDAGFFASSDYPNPARLSTESIQKALGRLVVEGVLEPRGERRGRRYRMTTDFLTRIYGGSFG